MYHGQISEHLQKYTLETLRENNCNLRVLICTIAFGMGVEITDVRQVIHWGKSKSLLCHWQEVGRCGRDGSRSKAIWYPKSTAGEDKNVFDEIKRDTSCCVRQKILSGFKLSCATYDDVAVVDREPCSPKCDAKSCVCILCQCCSHCQKKCGCNE